MRALKRPEFVPIAEAASRLGCSVRTLQRIARDGGISFVRRGRFSHVLREDLARLEVDGRTDWVVNRLVGPGAESMRVAEWFRQWIELQRLMGPTAVGIDLKSSVAAAEHVIAQDGDQSMVDYRVSGFTETLNGSGLAADQAIGLRLLAHWPGSPRLLEAYREVLRSLAGWQSPPENPSGRRRRAGNGRLTSRQDGHAS